MDGKTSGANTSTTSLLKSGVIAATVALLITGFGTQQESAAQSDEDENVTSDDLYERFKVAFEAAGGASNFRIGVGASRGVTPPSAIACMAALDLPGGTADITCEGLTETADAYLVDNQPAEEDSALPESHDVITPIGQLVPDADGTAQLQAELGAGFFADSEVDLVALIQADAEPTAHESLVALGVPNAFMRRFWREVRETGGTTETPDVPEDAGTDQALSSIQALSAPEDAGTDQALSAAEDASSEEAQSLRSNQALGLRSIRRGGGAGGFGRRETTDPRVRLGLVDETALKGAELFFRETFRGNGRTCATCHRAEDNLGLSPAFVQDLLRRGRRGLRDPLFVAHPRFRGRGAVPQLEVPFLVNEYAMIRENIDGFEAAAEKFTMRGVPHSLSLSPTIMPPLPRADGTLPDGSSPFTVQRTGWSGDGAPNPGSLRMFPVGATIQHFRRQFDDITPGRRNFRLPNDDELDAMESYMLITGRIEDVPLDQIVLEDGEAEGGRGAFTAGGCGMCHGNAGANPREALPDDLAGDDLGNRNFDTGVERLDTPARELYLAETGEPIPCDGGFGGQGLGVDGFNLDSDCGIGADADATGDGADNPDAFGDGGFNTVSLIESADTGPFFHNNAVDTIEEAVAFYRTSAFNESPGAQQAGVDFSGLPDPAVINIGAFLRTMNAGFNLRIAEQRCAAAATILEDAVETSRRGEARATRRIVDGLIRYSSVELEDAMQVLSREDAEMDDMPLGLAPLYPEVSEAIEQVMAGNRTLLRQRRSGQRLEQAAACRDQIAAARESLTAGDSPQPLDFSVGAGNLLF